MAFTVFVVFTPVEKKIPASVFMSDDIMTLRLTSSDKIVLCREQAVRTSANQCSIFKMLKQ
jgi:hypothetical protein